MPEIRKLRLRDIEHGDTWFIHDPVRIATLISLEEIPVKTENPEEVRAKPGVMMRVTIPAEPIPGLWNERQAKDSKRIRDGLLASADDMGRDDAEWREVWTERLVRQIKHDKFGARPDEDKPRVPQLYCLQTLDRLGPRRAESRSLMTRGQIEASLVPSEMVLSWPHDPKEKPHAQEAPQEAVPPGDEEGTQGEAPEEVHLRDDAEGRVEAEPRKVKPKKVPYLKAKQMAKDAGVDISDIKGSGAVGRILERLEAANVGV